MLPHGTSAVIAEGCLPSTLSHSAAQGCKCLIAIEAAKLEVRYARCAVLCPLCCAVP